MTKNRKGKEYRLLTVMAEAYWRGGHGVDTEKLCLITPAYSQRFGDWRKNGISVTKEKNKIGTFTYFLKTDPEMIDWDNFKLIYKNIPVRPRGRRGRVNENQMVINL